MPRKPQDQRHHRQSGPLNAELPRFGTMMAVSALVLVTLASHALAGAAADQERHDRFVDQGIQVEMSVTPVDQGGENRGDPVAGKDAVIRFAVKDASTGAPLRGLYPAAWLDPKRGSSDGPGCAAKISSFIQGRLAFRPRLDLNVWHLVTLNDKPNLAVLDPMLGFSGQRLLALPKLESPGEDWVHVEDEQRLFVSQPLANRVAIVDTDTWRVALQVEAGPKPGRLALQNDQAFVWVGLDDRGGRIAVIDSASGKTMARIETGAGPHDFAFTNDDAYAFVTNRGAGTVSVIDVQSLKKLADLKTGPAPAAIAYSSLAEAAYVIDAEDGSIQVIDGPTRQLVGRLDDEPGLTAVAVSRDGRWGFAVNRDTGRVHIFDTSSNRFVAAPKVGDQPDQVTLTQEYAYFRLTGGPKVSMIDLRSIANGAELRVVQIPGGQAMPGRDPSLLAMAAAIAPTPEDGAVVIANPLDRTVYYHMEGMNAPMGSFNNRISHPKAVLAVDKGLRETEPGIYQTTAAMPDEGEYDLAFLIDTPRVTHCFDVAIAADPTKAKSAGPIIAAFTDNDIEVKADQATTLRFNLVQGEAKEPVTAEADVVVQALRVSGAWQRRLLAKKGEDGAYETRLNFPEQGLYYLYLINRELGLRRDRPALILRVGAPAKPSGSEPNRS